MYEYIGVLSMSSDRGEYYILGVTSVHEEIEPVREQAAELLEVFATSRLGENWAELIDEGAYSVHLDILQPGVEEEGSYLVQVADIQYGEIIFQDL